MKGLSGMVSVRITSADTASAMRAILDRGIFLYDVEHLDDLRTDCTVEQKDIEKLKELCESRGETLELRKKSGIFWILRGLLRRPVLVLGLTFLITLAIGISTRVLFVQVDGNVTVPDRKILEAAESAGIRFGASRRELRSEQVKNTLLEAMPELKWACVNTYGCVAKITVRERSEPEETEKIYTLGSIVASRDGVVLSCTATKGTLLCAVGQAVRKGETLISGYTDCGIIIEASQAEGEVYAQTLRELESVVPLIQQKKGEIISEAKKYSLIFGKKRINLWKSSGISDTLCDRMYEEYYVTLPGGFRLPFGFAVETLRFRETETSALSQQRAESLLRSFAENYLRSQMVAGSIQASEVQITHKDSCFFLTGEYVCTEMIGRQQQEQIGE